MTDAAKEYAVALFTLAKEESLEEEISKSLGEIAAILRKTPEYLDLLASPNIPIAERIDTIDKAFSGSVHEYTASFLKLLCKKGHIRQFHRCVSVYEELYRGDKGISAARVISAAPLTKEEKDALKKKLEHISGHSVIMEYSRNRDIIGGVIVHMDGRVIDGSLRRRLHDIKEVIEQ